MQLIIAEKPSVARDIAAVIGARERCKFGEKSVYYKGSVFMVANVRGHFIRLAEPQEYDEKYAKWRISDLPIIPNPLKLLPIDDKKAELVALGKLMNSSDVDTIICATDAGREGELIFRYIYSFVGCKKPFKRLWISSLTEESIRSGMENLLDGKDKDNLYKSGNVRAITDWLIGMNLSRLYSCYYSTVYTVGRVQTATLNMIVQRDREIESFVKKPFYKLYLENGAEWFNEDGNTVPTIEEAEKIRAECANKTATVIKAETKRKTENRPLLYSLTSLQREANDLHGFSAAKTLTIMQDLYEKKLLTYPRTDSNYLSSDMPETIAKTVQRLSFYDSERVNHLAKIGLNLDKRVIDDSKVSDHHAIIPTTDITKMQNIELTADEKAILNMVIERLFLSLDEIYVYNEISYVFAVGEHNFSLTDKIPVKPGWRAYTDLKENQEPAVTYRENDSFPVAEVNIKEGETQPQKPFTESSLLAAMENIDKRLDDKELRQFVKERGLGTPATRAAVIERIIKLEYVARDKKNLRSTPKGRQLVDSVPEIVKSPEMTANMESLLSDVEAGTADSQSVVKSTLELIQSVMAEEKSKEHENRGGEKERPVLGKCPKCGGNVYEGKKNYYCENSPEKCFFSVWKDDYFWKSKRKTITPATMKALLKHGKLRVTGFYSEKSGKEYDAIVFFQDRKDSNQKDKVGFGMEFEKK